MKMNSILRRKTHKEMKINTNGKIHYVKMNSILRRKAHKKIKIDTFKCQKMKPFESIFPVL